MGLFRKDRHSPDSEPVNSEPSKKSPPKPQHWGHDASQLSNLRKTERKLDANQRKEMAEKGLAMAKAVQRNSFNYKYTADANRSELAQALQDLQIGVTSNADMLRFNLEQMAEYFSQMDEDEKAEAMGTKFDPFAANPRAQNRLNSRLRAKQLNQPDYRAREEDFQAVLDPLSLQLQKDPDSLTRGMTEYLSPYSAAFSLVKKPMLTMHPDETHEFLLKLGLTKNGITQQVLTEKLPFSAAETFKSIDDVYTLFDRLIDKHEAMSNQRLPRDIEASLLRRSKNGLSDDKKYPSVMSQMEKMYFDKYMVMDEKTGVPQYVAGKNKDSLSGDREVKKYVKPKVRQQILCPDHGNPMMRKKGDNEHLYCTVVGCKQTLKRKVPLPDVPEPPEVPEPPKQKEDVVPELPEELQDELTPIDSKVTIAATNLTGPFYTPNAAPVELHQENGRVWICQGPVSIDITMHAQGINLVQQMVNVSSFANNFAQSVGGYVEAHVDLRGLQLR